MNRRTDIIDELRRANPVPDEATDASFYPTAARLRTSLPNTAASSLTQSVDRPTPPEPPRVWRFAAAAAVIAVGGVAVTAVVRDTSDPAATVSSVAPAPTTVMVAPEPAQLLPPVDRELEPGTYYFGSDPVVEPMGVTVTVPAGWQSAGAGAAVTKLLDYEGHIAVSAWSIGSIYTDPCAWAGTAIEPEPSVDGVVSAFVEHRQASQPVDVEVDGYPGKRLELRVPSTIDFADCDASEFRSWTDSEGGVRFHQGPGQVDELLIIDVDGAPLLIDVNHLPGATDQDLAEQQAVVESIRIDPRPRIDGLWTMSLTVDELDEAPEMSDADEHNNQDWGDFTLRFDGGQFTHVHHQPNNTEDEAWMYGTYHTEGDVLSLDLPESGEQFVMRWHVEGDTLVLEGDDSLGVAPTGLVIKPWTRQSDNVVDIISETLNCTVVPAEVSTPVDGVPAPRRSLRCESPDVTILIHEYDSVDALNEMIETTYYCRTHVYVGSVLVEAINPRGHTSVPFEVQAALGRTAGRC